MTVLRQVCGRDIITVMFYPDWRKEILQEVVDRAVLVDIFIMTGKSQIDEYRKAGVRNPIFITDACDRYEHRRRVPVLPIWKSDVAFIGAARPNELRVNLVRRIGEFCKFRLYGKNWGQFGIKATLKVVGPRRYGLICGGSKIILGADSTSTENGFWSNRLWLTLGCGGFLLTNYVPGMEEIFTNRKHLVWYYDEEECISLVREYLEKPEDRKRIAEEGYQLVHSHHTFHHFVDKVLAICEDYHH